MLSTGELLEDVKDVSLDGLEFAVGIAEEARDCGLHHLEHAAEIAKEIGSTVMRYVEPIIGKGIEGLINYLEQSRPHGR